MSEQPESVPKRTQYELDYGCAKCGAQSAETVVLGRVRHLRLCNRCRTDWEEYARASVAYRNLIECTAHQNYLAGACRAGDRVSCDEWVEQGLRQLKAECEMFALSTEWLRDKEEVKS